MKLKRLKPHPVLIFWLLWGLPVDAEETAKSKKGRFSPTSWYLYGGTLGNYEELAEEMVPSSIFLEVLGGLGELTLVSADVETTTQLGLGGTYCVNEHFSLDFGLQYGSEHIAYAYATPFLVLTVLV